MHYTNALLTSIVDTETTYMGIYNFSISRYDSKLVLSSIRAHLHQRGAGTPAGTGAFSPGADLWNLCGPTVHSTTPQSIAAEHSVGIRAGTPHVFRVGVNAPLCIQIIV